MDRIRVIVANRPRLMRELVLATLADQPDVEVVGESDEDAKTLRLAIDSRPDVVIVALDRGDQRPEVCEFLLARSPAIRIVALAMERNYAVCLWSDNGIQSIEVENSEQGILDALRNRTQAARQLSD